MLMDMSGTRGRAMAVGLGALGLGYGVWRMSQGQRDWLAWTAAAAGTAKLVEGMTGWSMMRAARLALPMDSAGWGNMLERVVPAAIKAWR